MDGVANLPDVRRRRSRAEAEQLLAEYEVSGLTAVEFCRQKGLSLATLARYRKRQADGSTAPANSWLAVEVSGDGAVLDSGANRGLVLALPCGRRIEVQRGFDAATLVQLLSVLERI